MSCSECRFAVYVDHGYSNYTVEGTDFYCAKKVHPGDGFDLFYGKDPGLKFGDTCSEKVPGEPVRMDVDGENQADLTAEEQEVWKLYRNL